VAGSPFRIIYQNENMQLVRTQMVSEDSA